MDGHSPVVTNKGVMNLPGGAHVHDARNTFQIIILPSPQPTASSTFSSNSQQIFTDYWLTADIHEYKELWLRQDLFNNGGATIFPVAAPLLVDYVQIYVNEKMIEKREGEIMWKDNIEMTTKQEETRYSSMGGWDPDTRQPNVAITAGSTASTFFRILSCLDCIKPKGITQHRWRIRVFWKSTGVYASGPTTGLQLAYTELRPIGFRYTKDRVEAVTNQYRTENIDFRFVTTVLQSITTTNAITGGQKFTQQLNAINGEVLMVVVSPKVSNPTGLQLTNPLPTNTWEIDDAGNQNLLGIQQETPGWSNNVLATAWSNNDFALSNPGYLSYSWAGQPYLSYATGVGQGLSEAFDGRANLIWYPTSTGIYQIDVWGYMYAALRLGYNGEVGIYLNLRDTAFSQPGTF